MQENIINCITNQYEKDILRTLLQAKGNSTKFHYLSSRLLGHVLKCKLQAKLFSVTSVMPLQDKPVNMFIRQDSQRLPAFALLLSFLLRAMPQSMYFIYSKMRQLQCLCYNCFLLPKGVIQFRGNVTVSFGNKLKSKQSRLYFFSYKTGFGKICLIADSFL